MRALFSGDPHARKNRDYPLRDRNIERVGSSETKVESTQKRFRRSDISRDRLLAQRSP